MVEPLQEELGGRVVADRDEDGLDVEVERLAVRPRAQPQPGHVRVAENLVHDCVGDELDLVIRLRSVEHDRRGAELITPCTTVTLLANLVRKIASSIAESPPPTTATGTSRQKAASQTAQ